MSYSLKATTKEQRKGRGRGGDEIDAVCRVKPDRLAAQLLPTVREGDGKLTVRDEQSGVTGVGWNLESTLESWEERP